MGESTIFGQQAAHLHSIREGAEERSEARRSRRTRVRVERAGWLRERRLGSRKGAFQPTLELVKMFLNFSRSLKNRPLWFFLLLFPHSLCGGWGPAQQGALNATAEVQSVLIPLCYFGS